LNNQYTYSEWAAQISFLSGKPVSKQGLFDRVHAGSVALSKGLLQHVLLRKIRSCYPSKIFDCFGRVLLQDSTALHLPQELVNSFPGNRSGGVQKAVAKIQSMLDVKAMRFLHFSLDAFTQNDQSASDRILPIVRKNDLVIRDLGYFSLSVFDQLIKAQAHFLSRLRFGISFTDEQGKPIRLQKLLRQKRVVDQWVYLGKDKKVRVRLVMIPLPAAEAAEKIRRAKNDRDKRLNHSPLYYQWLRFSVYITTVDEKRWTAAQVYQGYKVRWQIEIIFKSWKTSFHLQDVLHERCTLEERVKVTIYLLLVFICLFMQKIFVRYKEAIEKKGRQISLLKLANYVVAHFVDLFTFSDIQWKEMIFLYCCYEKRKKRKNMTDLFTQNGN
jgi:hypothetical protein